MNIASCRGNNSLFIDKIKNLPGAQNLLRESLILINSFSWVSSVPFFQPPGRTCSIPEVYRMLRQ